ncbi:agmatinase [Fusibacter sp. 3D3]|uniref:agmatinase n=1 Tax=Fusibacter sp. 3D3 TaxID=1048380 RepID=UPI000852BF90|nr:agmatinase [Fusibacter sp. 3D3]GAU78190.1 agmatinase [Fusibacter sp. 3D3]
MHSNIHTFIGCDSDYQDAELVIYGAPFDSTTSFRPGTRFAADFIRMDSYGLETYSPYQDKDLADYALTDVGNLDLPFGNAKKSLEVIEDMARTILKAGKKPFLIGGEHLVSLGAIKASYEVYPDLVLFHLDAHADLREHYMGEPLSHSTVIRRAWDFMGDHKINQFCIRSGEKWEFEWAKSHTHLEKFTFSTLKERIAAIGPKTPCYITIDLDVLDPSIFSGTGTPEPGGISFIEMMTIIQSFKDLNVIGADIVELSPHYDQSGVSTATACKVMREFLLAILR